MNGEPHLRPVAWRVETLAQASWASTRLAAAAETIRASREVAAAELAAVTELIEAAHLARVRQAQSTVDRFTALLTDWHARSWSALTGDGDETPTPEVWAKVTKSVKLTGATVRARREPGSWKWDDRQVAGFLAAAAPNLVRPVVVSKAAVAERITLDETGRALFDGAPIIDVETGELVSVTAPAPYVTVTVEPVGEWSTVVLPAPAGVPDDMLTEVPDAA